MQIFYVFKIQNSVFVSGCVSGMVMLMEHAWATLLGRMPTPSSYKTLSTSRESHLTLESFNMILLNSFRAYRSARI